MASRYQKVSSPLAPHPEDAILDDNQQRGFEFSFDTAIDAQIAGAAAAETSSIIDEVAPRDSSPKSSNSAHRLFSRSHEGVN